MARLVTKNVYKWIGLSIYPFFIFLGLSTVKAQQNLPPGFEQAINLRFEEARNSVNKSSKNQTPHLNIYIDNLTDVLELLFSENIDRYGELESNEKSRLKAIRNSETESPYDLFFEAEIKMQWAFLKLKFGEQWSAAWSLRSAYKTIKRNIKKYPEFELNQKSIGLLHVIFGAVPERYQWLLGLLGLEGDVLQGLDELHDISGLNSLFGYEARLTSAMVHSYLLEQNTEAISLLSLETSNLTLVERYVSGLILMKAHQAIKARAILSKNSDHALFKYLIAETYFQEGKYAEANQYYSSFLNQFDGINGIKDAHFKKSLCFLFTDDRKSYLDERAKAAELGENYSEVDKNAVSEMDNTNETNLSLLKLRYALDGGFFQSADSLISILEATDLNHYEQIQLNYRKARLSHIKGDFDTAISWYGEIIKSDNLIPENYFAPNALLQLGYIYIDRKDTDKANMYLQRVLKFRKHPYKNSLDSKAIIALRSIKN